MDEIQKWHGVLGVEHKCGIRRLENKIRESFDCVGLRRILHGLCQSRCLICQLTTAGTVWLVVSIKKFNPVPEVVGRSLCNKFKLKYKGVPAVEFAVPFRSPVTVDAISPNGNCVFLALMHGIGAEKANHNILRQAVFAHMEKHDIREKLPTKYQDGLDDCEKHRAVEKNIDCTVCGIVVHAAASLLGIDILVHWESEDGKLEWMLGLCSLQKKVWGDYQIALRFINNHVDFISRLK